MIYWNFNMTPRFFWSFFYFWFGFVCAQVSSGNCETMESWKICKFDPKASESWQNFNISLSQHTEVELRQTESFRNFFNEDPGHGLTERLHVDNYQPRIPRAPFLCECCYNAPQYGEHGEHCECYVATFTQYRQWLRELNTLRRWKWSAIVCNMQWLDYSMEPAPG